MRRAILALTAAVVLTFGTALPVASSGLTDVTISCSDGSTSAATVDAETLEGLVQSVQALTLYPAGLSCSLATVPLFQAIGGIASAWPGGGFIVGGGRFQVGCPDPPFLSFWVNFAVSAHTVSATPGATQGGTLNLTIPGGQCVGPSHLTSKPFCLKIDADSAPPPPQPGGFYRAYMWSHVTQTSGAYFANLEDDDFGSGWKDTGNPGKQWAPDRVAFDNTSSCPDNGSPDPDSIFSSHPIPNGNVTIHPAQ